MLRYFFHLRETDLYVFDDEGLELDGVEAAHAVAVDGARSLLATEARRGRLPLGTVMEVDDQHGIRAFELRFRDAVTLER